MQMVVAPGPRQRANMNIVLKLRLLHCVSCCSLGRPARKCRHRVVPKYELIHWQSKPGSSV